MVRPIFTVAGIALLTACSIPRTVARLQDRSPPAEFGRPGWVRFLAGTGAWIGGITGGAVSIVLLPVTYPISLLADDGLGEAGREELMFFPASGLAATGHFLLGGGADMVDFTLRRAWFSDPQPPNTYELVPMGPPKSPLPEELLPRELSPEEPAPPEQSREAGDPAGNPAGNPAGDTPGGQDDPPRESRPDR